MPPEALPTGMTPRAGSRDSIPGTLVRFDMVPIPGTSLSIGRTEVTWDEYDVFAFRLDLARGDSGAADAESRPSRPYGAPDRGFGHAGFPAIGIAYPAALAYAEWLSRKTGHRYRLPTDAEWSRVAQLGLAPRGTAPDALAAIAWYKENAGETTHRVATRAPDALGLHDLAGNAAEWVVSADGRPLVRGGSYADSLGAVGAAGRARQTPAWQSRDAQLPRSRWWLSDAPFVGFRLVRDP